LRVKENTLLVLFNYTIKIPYRGFEPTWQVKVNRNQTRRSEYTYNQTNLVTVRHSQTQLDTGLLGYSNLSAQNHNRDETRRGEPRQTADLSAP